VRLKIAKFAPIWLPIGFFLRDVVAWIYVFSYEPGITAKAVQIHHFLLIPGVFFNVEWAFVFDTLFGVALGFGIREASLRRFPVAFPLLALSWNLILLGIVGFLAPDSHTMAHLFRIGMEPGRHVGHWLLGQHIIFTDPRLLALIMVTINFAAAVGVTAAYVYIQRTISRSGPGPSILS
jgi:hypothetical protein